MTRLIHYVAVNPVQLQWESAVGKSIDNTEWAESAFIPSK